MTHQEIYQQLNKVDNPTWTKVKELLSEYSLQNRQNYLQQIDLAALSQSTTSLRQ